MSSVDDPNSAATGPILLYDGRCGFCNTSVQMILRHDRRRTMRFAALQSVYGESVRARHPELCDVDSVVLVEHTVDGGAERVFIRSDAVLHIAAYLGGTWKLLAVFLIIPRGVRDFFYDAFARHRYRWFGKYDSCLMPAADVRSRFIDSD